VSRFEIPERALLPALNKRENNMKVAVPTNDGALISPHFGRSAGFLVYEVEEGKIKGHEFRSNAMQHSHDEAHGHEAGGSEPHNHAGLLSSLAGCEIVICAGMGWRAAEALKSAGVREVLFTAPAPAEEAVSAYLAGTLPVANQSLCRCSH
jgi:predicted Fe-Mo cluster-binding NifX family protein